MCVWVLVRERGLGDGVGVYQNLAIFIHAPVVVCVCVLVRERELGDGIGFYQHLAIFIHAPVACEV